MPAPLAARAFTGMIFSALIARHIFRERVARRASVEETATRLALHPNTARNHLEALVEVGLASREQAPAVGRGRPGAGPGSC